MGNINCHSSRNQLPGDIIWSNVHGEIASFGMQCFWDLEAHFGVVPGVIRVRVGYSGGNKKKPTDRNIGDHTETVEVEYDPEQISYQDLLEIFWKHSVLTSQFKTQYRSVIFYHTQEQKNLAEEGLKETQRNYQEPICTTIEPAAKFYKAEQYHQKYRLRHRKHLMRMLGCSKSSKLDGSHVAARLNGYACKYGTIKMFEKEKDLCLSPEVIYYFIELLASDSEPFP